MRSVGADWRAGLGEFADCLQVGLLVALASVPVLTAPAAFAAGCRAHARARYGAVRPLWTQFWADFRQAARGGVAFGALAMAAGVLFAADLVVAGSVLPGAGVVKPALWALAVAAAVIAVRTCEVAGVRGQPWRRAVVTAARATATGPRAAALTAAAVAVAGVLVWMQPLLIFLVAGPLTLAAVATGGRG
ncbi:MAG TPA: hypothetical protein VJT49_29270 [Amycolatopsis sp.]|uniref:hypothetical protein n=1 Tax=Amycolatopsis sp. TaxID=37632 RepID=UPI002B46F776|nr:hypothetical protein [Amycolatopsis sp.]HKS49129.1 hypothetical protein [Amycolatopsis sp.]